jgi:hypothetical protein
MKAKYSDKVLVSMTEKMLRRLLAADTPALRQIAKNALRSLAEVEVLRKKSEKGPPEAA